MLNLRITWVLVGVLYLVLWSASCSQPTPWETYNDAGTGAYEQGQYAEAEKLFVAALKEAEKALGPDHPDVARSLNNLALLYHTQGKYAEAEPLYERSLAIREKALGPDRPDVGRSLNNLAELYYTQGKYAEVELQRAQVYTIPFENLDIQLGRGIDLTASYVDDKVIRRQRGGYCFELNGLFLRALTATGFEARPLLARVHIADEPTGRQHQISLVSVAGRDWVVDVGFGKFSPRVPIPFEVNTIHDHDGTSFRLIDHDLGYMLQNLQDDHWMNLYTFDLCPVVPNDIAEANYFTSTNPTTPFATYRIAVLCYPDGTTTLFNYRCTTSRRGEEQVEQLPNSDLYLEELKHRFGIQLDATYDQLRPVQEDM